MGRTINTNYNTGSKIYVNVIAQFSADGGIVPQEVVWEDGRRFPINKVLDVRPQASRKAGGAGICYTIRIGNANVERKLYLEDNRWFVERG